MYHVFIDSNIFLDVYKFGKEDLDALGELIPYLELRPQFIKIYLTSQVRHEFHRNREGVLVETFKSFNDSKIEIKMNSIFKNYAEYEEIGNLQKNVVDIKARLSQKVEEAIESKKLSADLLIGEIFSKSFTIDSDKYLEKAIIRYRLGNPPGKKNNSYGDEINWEALLGEFPDSEDLIIISGDKDFESKIKDNEVNSFLFDEWKKIKKSDVYLYKSLSELFNDKDDINIDLQVEKQKNELIADLFSSKSFAFTHVVISRLSKFNFSDQQEEELIEAFFQNDQIHIIREDQDISLFYKNIMNRNKDFMEQKGYLEKAKRYLSDNLDN